MMNKDKKTALKLVGVCLLPLMFLSGCHANGHYSNTRDISKYTEAISSRENITRENAVEAMALYERLYARNTGEKTIAIKYAEALRKAGYPKQAVTILSPIVNLKMNPDAGALSEYAAASIESGDFKRAEKVIDRILKLDGKEAKKYKARANHYKALILSAKGEHKVAEGYYGKALDEWSGDPAVVMNNLALNLAEQGDFEGAIAMLKQASDISNDASLVKNNIKLVNNLRAKLEKN